ncbi:hypothetical protein E4U42_004133 [Claviceps africana]|uniref:DNA endonuclease activator Ctp1 C-terminal domain-containing protein n=1 Tax=Claviceps africana TaxID=83212 RepID=A0A8K0NIB6_9HYPO|nr:hypothetical protein E4U42_004133 [Claviceps africana]
MAADRFQKGRQALFEALSGVCDQIEAGLRKDQQDQATESNATMIAQLDVIEKLRAENEALRGQLAEIRSTGMTSTEIDPPPTIENALPGQSAVPQSLPSSSAVPRKSTPAAGSGCKGDCSKVLRRYHVISANFKIAKDALERKRIERIQWARHAEYLNTKIREAEEQYSIQILDHQAPRIDVPSATAIDAEGVLDPALSFISEDGSPAAEPELPDLLSKAAPHEGTALAVVTSSQTTQGQASDSTSHSPAAHALHDDIAIKSEPSSDAPEIITERKVKKRKRAHDEVDAVVEPFVKSELDGGSSPIMSIPAAKLCTQESLDLGDIGQKVQTPRKRRFLEQSGPQTEITSRFKLRALTPLSAQAPRYSHSAKISRQNSALMPLDGNIRLIKPTCVKRGTKDRRRELAISIAELSEDYAIDEAIEPTKTPEESRNKSARSRLDVLLDGGSEETDVNTALTPTRNQPVPPARETALRVPKRRQLPFENTEDRDGKNKHAARVLSMYNNTELGSRASTPKLVQRQLIGTLRNKPPSELQLSDFKINPSANEGHDFAFSEVVRDRADRACLPGCINMHCCGKQFRALAISQRPDPPLTSAQRQEEQKLLEGYLGDSSYRLATMEKEERMELWIEAKTQELANKYGKHRHRFSRMQSPPGFWDADFPNTQQLEADRQEATKRTKQAIAERYREALRPGGRWKFTDE